jgi:PIN domain nuclease of toxin-antitoxin system
LSGYLLDTNAAMFIAFKSSELRESGVEQIAGVRGRISQVCAIEMAIKHSLGKLALPPPFQTDFTKAFVDMAAQLDAEIAAIELRHIDRLSRLPFFHRDPFDRLLICQSLEDDLALVTRDRVFAAYPGLRVIQI